MRLQELKEKSSKYNKNLKTRKKKLGLNENCQIQYREKGIHKKAEIFVFVF